MTRRPTTPPAGRAARAFRHLAVLGACAAAVGALTACGDEASTANGGTGVPEPTTAVTDLPPAANGPECLYGDWVVSDAELGGYFAVVAANTGFDSVDGSGTITMSFTPTGFVWTNDYEVTAVMGADTFVVTQTGSVAGTYTEDDGTLTGNAGTDDRQATFTQNGQPVDSDLGDLFAGVFPARPMDAMGYSCSGPTVVIPAGPGADDVATVTLERA